MTIAIGGPAAFGGGEEAAGAIGATAGAMGTATGNDAAGIWGAAGKGGAEGAAGIAIGWGAGGGGAVKAGAIAGGACGAALAEPPITRVNSPGAAGAAGAVGAATGVLDGVCRGSKLSVKDCSGGIGAAGVPVPGIAPPPPKMRVNSPGAFCDGEPTGKGSREASEGGDSGFRNSRVNSPG
jgi:hypothetical protein